MTDCYTGCDALVKAERNARCDHDGVSQWHDPVMADTQRVPHFIGEWRKKRRLSLRQLANMLETAAGEPMISHASLGRIEAGKQPFSEPILNAISRALDVPRAWLLEREPDSDAEIIDLMRHIDDRDRQHILDQLKLMAERKMSHGT